MTGQTGVAGQVLSVETQVGRSNLCFTLDAAEGIVEELFSRMLSRFLICDDTKISEGGNEDDI